MFDIKLPRKISMLALGSALGLALLAGSASADPGASPNQSVPANPSTFVHHGDLELCDPGVVEFRLQQGRLEVWHDYAWWRVTGNIIVGHTTTGTTVADFPIHNAVLSYAVDGVPQADYLGASRLASDSELTLEPHGFKTYEVFVVINTATGPNQWTPQIPTVPDVVLEPMEGCPEPEKPGDGPE